MNFTLSLVLLKVHLSSAVPAISAYKRHLIFVVINPILGISLFYYKRFIFPCLLFFTQFSFSFPAKNMNYNIL